MMTLREMAVEWNIWILAQRANTCALAIPRSPA